MDNQTFNYLLALVISIIILFWKYRIHNSFTYERKSNGTIRTCKKCGTKQWKSDIVGKWTYHSEKENINRECSCRNHIDF